MLIADAIRFEFERVEACRSACRADPSLASAVLRLKHFQQARLRLTHVSLFDDPNEARAADFFLEDLYGVGDFATRDREFQRVVPALVRWFPLDVVETVQTLARLHALSETLDLAMARELVRVSNIDLERYRAAWCSVSTSAERDLQREWTRAVGAALIRQTRSAALRRSLRLMRTPARLAGLGELQAFLERGFDTFGALERPEEFLNGILDRERRFADHLFGQNLNERGAKA